MAIARYYARPFETPKRWVFGVDSYMTKHMKVFGSMADYEAWISEDQYLPHACFVPAQQTPISEITKQTPGRVYFSRIGDEFLQIANGGQLYITDNAEERGWLDESGTLHIESPYCSISGETIVYNDVE